MARNLLMEADNDDVDGNTKEEDEVSRRKRVYVCTVHTPSLPALLGMQF